MSEEAMTLFTWACIVGAWVLSVAIIVFVRLHRNRSQDTMPTFVGEHWRDGDEPWTHSSIRSSDK